MQKKINVNVSLIRIFATMGVVFFHTCSTIVLNPDLFSITNLQANFLRIGYQLFLWTVPVFFMITGYLLLDSSRNLAYDVVFKKYILRVFLALLLFSIPFSVMKMWSESHIISIGGVISAFVGNGSLSHLWYLYALIGLYLLLPLLNKLVIRSDLNDLIILLACFFVMNFVFPMLGKFLNMGIAFSVPMQYPVFYFLIGYLCKNIRLKKKHIVWMGFITLCCVGLLVILVARNNFHYITDSNATPLIAIYSISLFFFSMNLDEIAFFSKRIALIWKIDRLCFAVYLIHPVFIQFAYRFLKITPLSYGRWYPMATFVFFIVFLLLSFASSYVLNLVPIIRKRIL